MAHLNNDINAIFHRHILRLKYSDNSHKTQLNPLQTYNKNTFCPNTQCNIILEHYSCMCTLRHLSLAFQHTIDSVRNTDREQVYRPPPH